MHIRFVKFSVRAHSLFFQCVEIKLLARRTRSQFFFGFIFIFFKDFGVGEIKCFAQNIIAISAVNLAIDRRIERRGSIFQFAFRHCINERKNKCRKFSGSGEKCFPPSNLLHSVKLLHPIKRRSFVIKSLIVLVRVRNYYG